MNNLINHFKTKLLAKLSLCIFALFLAGCGANINGVSPVLTGNDYLIISTTSHKDPSVANKHATKLLLKQLIKAVHQTSLKLPTNLMLQNCSWDKYITYASNKNSTPTVVSTGLTTINLKQAINYLQQHLTHNIVNLTPLELQNEYINSSWLLTLAIYANQNNIPIRLLPITNYYNIIQQKINGAMALTFTVLPKMAQGVQIYLDNKTYYPQTTIFLNPGRYYYTVYAQGFKPVTRSLQIPANNTNINIYLQKALHKPLPVQLKINNNSGIYSIPNNKILTVLTSLTNNYQIVTNNFTSNHLIFNFLPAIYKNNSIIIPVKLDLIKWNKIKLSKTYNLNYYPVTNPTGYNKASINKLIEQLDNFIGDITVNNNLEIAFGKSNE